MFECLIGDTLFLAMDEPKAKRQNARKVFRFDSVFDAFEDSQVLSRHLWPPVASFGLTGPQMDNFINWHSRLKLQGIWLNFLTYSFPYGRGWDALRIFPAFWFTFSVFFSMHFLQSSHFLRIFSWGGTLRSGAQRIIVLIRIILYVTYCIQ